MERAAVYWNGAWGYFNQEDVQKNLQKGFLVVAIAIEAATVFSCIVTCNFFGVAWNGATMVAWIKLFNISDEFLIINRIQGLFHEVVRVQAEVREGVIERDGVIQQQRGLIAELNQTIESLRQQKRALEGERGRIEELVVQREQLQIEYERKVREHRLGIEEMRGIFEGYENRKEALRSQIQQARGEYEKIRVIVNNLIEQQARIAHQLSLKTDELGRIIDSLRQARAEEQARNLND
ncbi:MAG: hypothetical protein KFB95_01420 [Simkaniaceae bacterium]|nr:MAG: hypothetical protein KFB95_01420 [Simkaniaceae bacterium]